MRTPRFVRTLYEPSRVFVEVAHDKRGLGTLALCVLLELALSQTSTLAAQVLRQRHNVLALAQSLLMMFERAFVRPAFLLALVAVALYARQHKATALRLDAWQSFCVACHAYPAHTALLILGVCVQSMGLPLPGVLAEAAPVWHALELLPSAVLLYVGVRGAQRGALEPAPVRRGRLVTALSGACTTLALLAQGMQVQRDWAVARPPMVGDVAPSFVAQTMDGASWDSRDMAHHVTLIEFWATWCAPCVRGLPRLQALFDTYQARGLRVAAINVEPENPAGVRQFWAEHKLSLPLLQDTGATRARFAVQGLPTSFILDAEGVVRHLSLGPPDWAEVESIVRNLLDQAETH